MTISYKIEILNINTNIMSLKGFILESFSTINDEEVIIPVIPSNNGCIYYINYDGNLTLDNIIDELNFNNEVKKWLSILLDIYCYKPHFKLYENDDIIKVSCGVKNAFINADDYIQKYRDLMNYDFDKIYKPKLDIFTELSLAYRSHFDTKTFASNRIFINGDIESSKEIYFKSQVYYGYIYDKDDAINDIGFYKIGRTIQSFDIRYKGRHATSSDLRKLDSSTYEDKYIKLSEIIVYPAIVNVEKQLLNLTISQKPDNELSRVKEIRQGKFNIDLENTIKKSFYISLIKIYNYDYDHNENKELFQINNSDKSSVFNNKLTNLIIVVILDAISNKINMNTSVIFKHLYEITTNYIKDFNRENEDKPNIVINNIFNMNNGIINMNTGTNISHKKINIKDNSIYRPSSEIFDRMSSRSSTDTKNNDKLISELLVLLIDYLISEGRFSKRISMMTISYIINQFDNTKKGVIKNIQNINTKIVEILNSYSYDIY
jgi:hypothetical protein